MQFRYEYVTIPLLLIALIGIVAFHEDERQFGYEELANSSTVNASFITDGEEVARLNLETAVTPEEKERGLMGRQSLEEDSGMIFVYEDSEERSFWMKDTYIPLDIIFLTAERTVNTIKQADPEPNVSDEDLKLYASEGPAKYVIEANQNFSKENNVDEGTEVRLTPEN